MFSSLARDFHEIIAELRDYRELLWLMTRRDIVIRYRKAVLGFGWAIFTPVVNMVVFTIVFNRVAKIQTDVPYPVFAYAGLLPWNLFSSSLRAAIGSLLSNKGLVTKVYCPRELFPLSGILVAGVDFLVGGTVLALLMAYYSIVPTWTILFLPVVLLVQLMFTTGLGFLLSIANLYFRDVKYIFDVGLSLWMFATPVVYPVRDIGGLTGILVNANPMTPIIDGYRSVLLRGELPDALPFTIAACISFALCAIGWVVFHRSEYTFAENI
jgi:ABC-2 type transport system permease protein/lipopolysaccharide transport system permease protein